MTAWLLSELLAFAEKSTGLPDRMTRSRHTIRGPSLRIVPLSQKERVERFQPYQRDRGPSTSNPQQSYLNRKPFNGNNSTVANKSGNKGLNSTASTTSSSSSSSRVRAQPLSASYKQFLKDNEGCYKCRKLFAFHRVDNCPEDWPTPGWSEPSAAELEQMKRAHTKRVAAVFSKNSMNESDDNNQKKKGKGKSVAAVMPEYNASEDEEDEVESDEDSVSFTVRPKHFMWHCQITPISPSSLPVKVNALIDNGSHLVLIHPELVKELGLPVKKLKVPEIVDVALKNGESSCTVLSEFVVLENLSSREGPWTSKRCIAVIAPNLCAQLILGLPFLVWNEIVIDHAARSCISRPSGFDLLERKRPINKEFAFKKLSKPVLRKKIASMKSDVEHGRKDLFRELNYILRVRKRSLKTEELKEVDPVAAIRKRVETLANVEDFKRREMKLKKQFAMVFEPIPHVDELPTEVLASIRLKDAQKTIATRTYGCPRKLRDSWNTLLHKHLDAGRIRPSSSPYASPSFVIPKSDPTALPR
ncbi:hypothetical protein C8J56DRAFT_1046897 [Mycena floridula]|nr:hypothetical protein C8J56DRAFT_1046897 [Mycena floridula]